MAARANRRNTAGRHRPSAGLMSLFGIGVLLVAALAGGQVWAMTGSLPWGVTAGIVAGAVVGAACRPLMGVLSGKGGQVMGEHRGEIDEQDFVDLVDVISETTPRRRIVHDVKARPESVARSVRSLLDGKGR